jgi:hypothetical protein
MFVSGETRDLTINIDSAKWRQIEKAYGSSLSPTVRADIVRASEALLFLESFERTPEPLAKVKVILEAHDKAGGLEKPRLLGLDLIHSACCRGGGDSRWRGRLVFSMLTNGFSG